MEALFGPAGTAESFGAMGYKKSIQVPEYLKKFSLTAFEYQCGHGVRIGQNAAEQLGAEAKKQGIKLSLHSPYYISLSSKDPEKRENSIQYILSSAQAAAWMGAERVVVHSGSCTGMAREEALLLAKDTLQKAQRALDEAGLGNIRLCPETMGKINQLGTLEEVLELCLLEERFLPCIDFGHLNARTFGGVQTREDFEQILDRVENRLGKERAGSFHSHFSKIEYTEKGGEKRHLTFADQIYGPSFDPLAELLAERGLTPTMICESAGTQTEDAQNMRETYLAKLNERKE